MPATSASENSVVCNLLSADFDGQCDDLLTAMLDKNDYDWLLTPPGTPLTNPLKCSMAVDGCDFPSKGELFLFNQSPASAEISRFSSTHVDPNSRRQDVTLLACSEFISRKEENGAPKVNGFRGSSLFSANNVASSVYQTTTLTPSRPVRQAIGAVVSSAQPLKPKVSLGKSKPSPAPVSHPTTQTSRDTATTGSQTGSFSSSIAARKTAPSSSATTLLKLQSRLLSQTHLLPEGLSGSSSVSKARSQPSKSAPGSRWSSPRKNGHRQEVPSKSQSSTSSPFVRSNLLTHTSTNSRTSSLETLNKSGRITSTRKALFFSPDQLEITVDDTQRLSSTNFVREKSAFLPMDIQVQAATVNPNNNIHLRKNRGAFCIAESTKAGDKIRETSHLTCSAISPDVSHSCLQVKPSEESRMSASFRLSDCVLQRSFDTAIHNLKLGQDSSSGHSFSVLSEPELSYLSSSTSVEALVSRNSLSQCSDRFLSAVPTLITPGGHNNIVQIEHFMRPLDVMPSRAEQTNSAPSAGGDCDDNWLQTPGEAPDGAGYFEEGLGKMVSCESPLVCPHGSGAITCDLCSVKMRLQMLTEKSKASFEASSQIFSEA